jgi:Ring finger domain
MGTSPSKNRPSRPSLARHTNNQHNASPNSTYLQTPTNVSLDPPIALAPAPIPAEVGRIHHTELFRAGNQIFSIGSYVTEDIRVSENRPEPVHPINQSTMNAQAIEAEQLDNLRQQSTILQLEFERLRAERDRLQAERELHRMRALDALARALPAEDPLFQLLMQTGIIGNTSAASLLPVEEVAPPPNDISENCSICLVDFNKRSGEAAFLECMHWYHFNCIKEWTDKGHKNCPECRKDSGCIFKIALGDDSIESDQSDLED